MPCNLVYLTVKAGEDVTVCGVLYNRWKQPYDGGRCGLTMLLRAGSVVIKNSRRSILELSEELSVKFSEFWRKYRSRPFSGRDKIVSSICPNLFGNYWVKLAVLLSLIGGVGTVKTNGEVGRSDIHMLLIGDPGTGKQLINQKESQNF